MHQEKRVKSRPSSRDRERGDILPPIRTMQVLPREMPHPQTTRNDGEAKITTPKSTRFQHTFVTNPESNTEQPIAQSFGELQAIQDARRLELTQYVEELVHKPSQAIDGPLVTFPENFSELLEAASANDAGTPLFWAQFMQGKPADDKENAWATNEQLRAGLERIRKLDIILARKTKKYNETCKAERKSATTPDPLQHLPMFVEDIAKITLTPLDEKRLETIMADDDTSPHPYTTFANGRLSEIDKQLQTYEDETGWDSSSTISTTSKYSTSSKSSALSTLHALENLDKKELQQLLKSIDLQLKALQEQNSRK